VTVADRLLTARDVAERLGVSTETVLRWVRCGELPAFKLPGGAIRFREDALDRWLAERATPRQGVLTAEPGAARSTTVLSAVLTADHDKED
jgi:excisionase family DNA binding protein